MKKKQLDLTNFLDRKNILFAGGLKLKQIGNSTAVVPAVQTRPSLKHI